MQFFKTSVFTKLIKDDEYLELQRELLINPLAGVLIRNSGGLRKLRWAVETKGKSGGIRVIKYYVTSDEQIFMLVAYKKGKKDDLTDKERAALRKLVREELL